MLYASICWIACPNLLVKSWIDSSSRLSMVCNELMFPFCQTEHKFWETKAAHNSLNEFMDPLGSLWNQVRAGPLRLAWNTLHRRRSFPVLRIIVWLKCIMWSYGSEEPSYMANVVWQSHGVAHNSRYAALMGMTTYPQVLGQR